jgi:hypothetical protein
MQSSSRKTLAYYASKLEALMDDTVLMASIFKKPLETQHCWYDTCTLPTDRPPVSLPLRYNVQTDQWEFEGTYCCWACAKRYNHDYKKGDPLRTEREGWINQLALRLGYITHAQTVPYALPRESLAIYGGTLSIEQFRQQPESILNRYSLRKWNPMFIPLVEIERGIIHDPSPLANVLVNKDLKRSKPKLSIKSYPKRMVVHTKDEMTIHPCMDIPPLEDLQRVLCLPNTTPESSFAHMMPVTKTVAPSVHLPVAIVPKRTETKRSFFKK